MGVGRKRLPDNIKLLRGTDNKSTTMNPDQPKYANVVPEPPEHLDEQSLVMWNRVTDMLHAAGVLQLADHTALQILAETYGEWRNADMNVKADGMIYHTETADGAPMIRPNPAVAQRADAARRLQSMLSEFGMTPASRSKVTVKDAGDGEDPAKRYFG